MIIKVTFPGFISKQENLDWYKLKLQQTQIQDTMKDYMNKLILKCKYGLGLDQNSQELICINKQK
jgi:hypothetical protein